MNKLSITMQSPKYDSREMSLDTFTAIDRPHATKVKIHLRPRGLTLQEMYQSNGKSVFFLEDHHRIIKTFNHEYISTMVKELNTKRLREIVLYNGDRNIRSKTILIANELTKKGYSK